MQQMWKADNILRKKWFPAKRFNQAFCCSCKNACHNAGYRCYINIWEYRCQIGADRLITTKTNSNFWSSSSNKLWSCIVANMKHASTYSPVAFRSVHTGIEPPFLLKYIMRLLLARLRALNSENID